MAQRRAVHRNFYPDAKQGQDTREVRPLAKAADVVDERGVQLDFFLPRARMTPSELQNFARWLFSLSHEATDLAASGLIDETHSYDVVKAKVVVPRSDK
jgi:hypothetical protein